MRSLHAVDVDKTSCNGYMQPMLLSGGEVGPHAKEVFEMHFQCDYEDSVVSSMADLKDTEGIFEVMRNKDGSSDYSKIEELLVPFKIK